MMPAEYTLDSMPRPLDPAVKIRGIAAYRAAAVQYSGRWTSEIRKVTSASSAA